MAYRILCAAACCVWLTIGCSSSSDDDFEFSESDMRAVVVGTWSGPISATNETVTLDLAERGGLQTDLDASISTSNQSVTNLRRVQNCGSRQFGSRRLGCIAVTTMAIEGNIASSGETLAASTLDGALNINGDELTYGDLHLSSQSGDTLSAQFTSGHFASWTYRTQENTTYTLELVRQ